MNLAGQNNPCGTKEQDRDASDRGKVIPVVKKCRIEMKMAGGNNPCGEKEEDRDASGRLKIIPMAQKSKMGMNPIGRNNPWRGISSNQDTFPTPKGIQRYSCQAVASNLLKFITAENS